MYNKEAISSPRGGNLTAIVGSGTNPGSQAVVNVFRVMNASQAFPTSISRTVLLIISTPVGLGLSQPAHVIAYRRVRRDSRRLPAGESLGNPLSNLTVHLGPALLS